MVRAFNQLALLVPTEILAETTPQARAKVITAYIIVSLKLNQFSWQRMHLMCLNVELIAGRESHPLLSKWHNRNEIVLELNLRGVISNMFKFHIVPHFHERMKFCVKYHHECMNA